MIKKDFKTMRALNGLRVCGNMDEYSLTRIITPSRIRRLKKEHIIEKVSYQDLHVCKEKNQYTYKLTNYGKQLTRKFLNKGNFQAGRGSERHNTALGHEYSKLKKEEQISCMNEMDLKNYLNEQYIYLLNENKIDEANELYEKMRNMSLVDLTYFTTSNEICCIEVITKNYSLSTIELKEYTVQEIINATDYYAVNID